jgi:hypothetical protein
MGVAAAVAAVVVSAYSANQQQQEQKKARRMQQRAYDDQKKAQGEQEAIHAQQRAAERRTQLREERVRRARVIQASANTGVANSSGELGAVGDLATQRGAALGFNSGLAMHGANISAYGQSAADALSSSQNHMVKANEWGQIGSLSLKLGSAAGSIFKSTSVTQPTTDAFGQNSYQGPVNADEWN